MESEDADDVESVEEEENYYSGGFSYDYSDEDDDGCDFNTNVFDEQNDAITLRSQKNFTILKEDDIRQRQEEEITRISTVLSISRDEACILLLHYSWSVNKVHEAWFSSEDRVRSAVGILEKPIKSLIAKEETCGICLKNSDLDRLLSATCGHLFCVDCWKAYISTSINGGPGSLMLRCPAMSCVAAVGQNMINKIASDVDKEKYDRYLLRSYVEDSRKIKWCPAPGCDYAVKYSFGSGSYDVTCRCSYSFCWNCTEEAHRPVDCETVAKWILKYSAELENMNRISANTKPCPKCKCPIEKKQRPMHMTCNPPCMFEFCWLCLGAWSEHGERTGGYYACNRYEVAKQAGVYDDAQRRREKYTHYYERWASNQSSMRKALTDLQLIHEFHQEKLSMVQRQPESQLNFILEAWQQIIECRRIIMWTHVYGYYIPEHEMTKKMVFEYMQGEAESNLDRLHQCAKIELVIYLNAEGVSKNFDDFRTKLADLTSVTRNYFEKLVEALENGLSDVDTHVVCGNKTSTKNVGCSRKGKWKKLKGS